MTRYASGARTEREVVHRLTDDGFDVVRSAGSKGAADLLAFAPGLLLLVQVKRYGLTIPPAERRELLRLAAHIPCALPIVAGRPAPRGRLTFRRLTGPGPKDWAPYTTDEVAP